MCYRRRMTPLSKGDRYAVAVNLWLCRPQPQNASLFDMKKPIKNSAEVEWEPAPAMFPKGADIAILSGDLLNKERRYVFRLRMPKGYKLPAHNHPTRENVTVLSGNFHVGMGDQLDEKKGIQLTAGGYAQGPAKLNHYAWSSSPTVIQLDGDGPFAITYVNPADDPSKK
jgi:quercetin dioxygenase-like cupin family protein